ncbi:hypothetical protein D3C80_1905140 [compost metagenome]
MNLRIALQQNLAQTLLLDELLHLHLQMIGVALQVAQFRHVIQYSVVNRGEHCMTFSCSNPLKGN